MVRYPVRMNRAHALRFFVILIAGLLLRPCGAQTEAKADDASQVVILNNADYFLAATVLMDQALRETMLQGSKRPIEFFAESLDSMRFPAQIDAELVALMRKKYVGKRVDVVLARASGGFAFAQRYRDELWPGAPIVFYNMLADQTPRGSAKANVTGIVIDLDPEGTLELARRLQPEATQLFVVIGTAEYDRRWKARLQPILARLPPQISVTWLDELPYEAIAPRLRQLGPNAIVLFTSMVRDSAGRVHNSQWTAHEIAEASASPVYGFIDTYMGQGVVGGALTDLAAQGRAAGQLALRVLAGERPDLIPVQASPPARCVVDARALERFKTATDRLPTNCEVRYRSPSFWRDYGTYVVFGTAALLLQTGLIVALLVQRRRRHEAERDAQHKRAELAQAGRLAIVGELTASISHEMNQPLGAILSNIDAAEMVLAAHPPDLDELRLIHSDIRRGGSRAAEVIRRIRGLLGKRDIARSQTDVNMLVTDVAALLRPEAARRVLDIETVLAESLPSVACDRVQIQQALLNLLLNAMDAVAGSPPESRRVLVRTAEVRGGVEVAVVDHGSGVAKDQMPQLFSSFFTTKTQGMGLGLSITRSIVEAHGGRIRAENNADGGATFSFVIPLAEAESRHGARVEAVT